MPLSLTAITNTLREWVVTATGLADNRVIWANQDGHRPTGSFVTLKMTPGRRVTTTDEVTQDFNAGRPAGQEIEFRVHGLREFALSVQSFSTVKRGDGSATDILSGLISSLSLDGTIASLQLANVSIFDASDIKDLSALLDADFEGRALIEFRGYLVDDRHAERTSYIETVNITATDSTKPDAPVEFPINVSIDN